MTTKIVAFVSLLALSLLMSANANANQVAPLEVALQKMRASRQWPVLVAAPNTSLVPSQEPIPSDVRALFNQIQKFVYGVETLISLRSCDGCQAIANANDMSVSLDPKFLRKLKDRFGVASKKMIAFVVAHEISHFTYEFITLSSPRQLSPNGNIPLLTKTFVDFVDLNQFMKMTAREQQAETMKYLAIASRSHSEVDLLGLLTLKRMGQDVSVEALQYLQAEFASRNPEQRAQTDFEFRFENLSKAVSAGDL